MADVNFRCTDGVHFKNTDDVRWKHRSRLLTETINLTDSHSRIWSIYRTFTETLILADTIIKRIEKTFLETLHLTDSYQRVVTWYRTFTETISLADSLRKTISKTFLESLGLADTLIKKVTYDRANKLQALESDKMFPSNIVRNIQHGLDAAKTSSPVKGDWYIAINTTKVYVCFLDDAWTEIYP